MVNSLIQFILNPDFIDTLQQMKCTLNEIIIIKRQLSTLSGLIEANGKTRDVVKVRVRFEDLAPTDGLTGLFHVALKGLETLFEVRNRTSCALGGTPRTQLPILREKRACAEEDGGLLPKSLRHGGRHFRCVAAEFGKG